MARIEVWFNNGDFRAFPNVKKETYEFDSNMRSIKFIFGEHEHLAHIFLDKVNFMEVIEG